MWRRFRICWCMRCKGLSQLRWKGARSGVKDRRSMYLPCKALFSTLTNVDFDAGRFVELIKRCVALREGLKKKVKAAGGKVDFASGPAVFQPAKDLDGLVDQGDKGRLEVGSGHRPGHSVPAAHDAVRHQRRGRICGSCPDSRPGRRHGLCLYP